MNQFGLMNEGMVIVALSSEQAGDAALVWLRADLWPMNHDPSEAKPLASASVRCLATPRESLTGLIFRLLYALDFQLALQAEKDVSGEPEA
jgi:hypothetical protein